MKRYRIIQISVSILVCILHYIIIFYLGTKISDNYFMWAPTTIFCVDGRCEPNTVFLLTFASSLILGIVTFTIFEIIYRIRKS